MADRPLRTEEVGGKPSPTAGSGGIIEGTKGASMARVLILTGDAAEELDSMYPVFRLREGGHEAVVAAPTTRAVKLVVHDF